MSTKLHISYLDSVRGLAALTVLSEHFVIAYGLPCQGQLCEQILDYSPLHFWWDGGAAVSLFFVLSGLVLSLKFFHGDINHNLAHLSLVKYTLARLFRIWLPYLVILAISAGLYVLVTAAPPSATPLPASSWITGMWHQHPLTGLDMLREAFLLKLPATNVLIPQAWTLAIELLLSLLLPIGLVLTAKHPSWFIYFLLMALSLLNLPVFLLHFGLGLLIACYYPRLKNQLGAKPWERHAILGLGFILYSCSNLVPGLKNEFFIWACSGFGAAFILIYVLTSTRIQLLLSWPLFRQIGKVSYSCYLLHMAILICLTPTLIHYLGYLSENRTFLWFSAWLLTIVIVQLVAMLFYYGLEMPCVSLGRRMIKLWSEWSERIDNPNPVHVKR